MKRFFTLIIIALIIFFAIKACQKFTGKSGKWQVEITEPFINVRTEPNQYSYAVARVIQGDKYYVLDINKDDPKYVWFKINYKGDAYWIASERENPFVKEYNNPNYGNKNIDYLNPVITNLEEEYHVKNLSSIEYNHLGIEDDNEFTVSHEVFYEAASEETGLPQYWIRYTIIDSYENKTMKTQKISFDEKPNTNDVKDISELTKKNK